MKRLAITLSAALLAAGPALSQNAFSGGWQHFPSHDVGRPVANPYSQSGGWPGRPDTLDIPCGAYELQHLVGEPAEIARSAPGTGHARFLRFGVPSDTMYNLQRLNIVFVGKSGDETVSRVYCG